MNAKELRIGNYCNVNDKIWKINPFDIVQLDAFKHDKSYIAIPLTEEWLLRFGFVKTPTKYYIGELNDLCNRDLDLVLTTNKNIISYQDYLHPIHYVHQLQNLYFVLTGEELKYNEL